MTQQNQSPKCTSQEGPGGPGQHDRWWRSTPGCGLNLLTHSPEKAKKSNKGSASRRRSLPSPLAQLRSSGTTGGHPR